MAGSQRLSFHIGLNGVDATRYGGWEGTLRACENDAHRMLDVAVERDFEPTVLLTKDATVKNVYTQIRKAAAQLQPGGFFFVTYSGHGGQVPDVNGDEETDRLDETWVLYDTQLIDDELYGLLSAFDPGVRVVVLSDSCHSGTVTREVVAHREANAVRGSKAAPLEVTLREFQQNQAAYRDRLTWAASSALPRPHVKVVLMSGCQDWQTSMDGIDNGAFTSSFLSAWDGGKFSGNYKDLLTLVRARLPFTQQPNLFSYGDGVEAMLLTMPLSD